MSSAEGGVQACRLELRDQGLDLVALGLAGVWITIGARTPVIREKRANR